MNALQVVTPFVFLVKASVLAQLPHIFSDDSIPLYGHSMAKEEFLPFLMPVQARTGHSQWAANSGYMIYPNRVELRQSIDLPSTDPCVSYTLDFVKGKTDILTTPAGISPTPASTIGDYTVPLTGRHETQRDSVYEILPDTPASILSASGGRQAPVSSQNNSSQDNSSQDSGGQTSSNSPSQETGQTSSTSAGAERLHRPPALYPEHRRNLR